jgi:hypothetical protein
VGVAAASWPWKLVDSVEQEGYGEQEGYTTPLAEKHSQPQLASIHVAITVICRWHGEQQAEG